MILCAASGQNILPRQQLAALKPDTGKGQAASASVSHSPFWKNKTEKKPKKTQTNKHKQNPQTSIFQDIAQQDVFPFFFLFCDYITNFHEIVTHP